MRKIIILTAVETERKAVLRAVSNSGKKNVQVFCIGMNAVHLDRVLEGGCLHPPTFAMDSAVEDDPPILILAGFAGALSGDLKVGDVVCDSDLANLPECVIRGKIATSPTLLSTPAQKKTFFEKTGALAVDMEGDIVKAAIKTTYDPIIHLRVISDSATDELDPRILGFVDELGRVKPLKLIVALLRSPSLLPKLVRLGRQVKMASKCLTQVIQYLIVQWG